MNLKIRKLTRKFGYKGVYIFFTILCDIYKNGYYLSVDEDYIFDLSDRSGIDIDELNKLFDYMTKLGLFNMKLFKSDLVFTSETIQKRFFLAKQNTFGKIICELPYLLMNVNKNASDTSECADNLNIDENKEEVSIELMPQSKEKYSRVLKEKEKKNKIEGGSKTLPTNTRTRVREAGGILPLSDFDLNIFLEDKEWCDAAISVAPAKDLTAENLHDKLNEFRNFIITTGGETTVNNIEKFKRRLFHLIEKKTLVSKNIPVNPNMLSALQSFFVENVADDGLSINFEQSISAVDLTTIALYATQIVRQSERNLLPASPSVDIQGCYGWLRCICTDTVVPEFFYISFYPAIIVCTWNPCSILKKRESTFYDALPLL